MARTIDGRRAAGAPAHAAVSAPEEPERAWSQAQVFVRRLRVAGEAP